MRGAANAIACARGRRASSDCLPRRQPPPALPAGKSAGSLKEITDSFQDGIKEGVETAALTQTPSAAPEGETVVVKEEKKEEA